MRYKICQFQNTSGFSNEKPEIIIKDDHPDWNKIYQNWLEGKNPTESKFWKRGVFANTKLCEKQMRPTRIKQYISQWHNWFFWFVISWAIVIIILNR